MVGKIIKLFSVILEELIMKFYSKKKKELPAKIAESEVETETIVGNASITVEDVNLVRSIIAEKMPENTKVVDEPKIYLPSDTESPGEDEMFEWSKGSFTQFNKYFNSLEFQCPCKSKRCYTQKISKKLIYKLTKVREEVGPIIVTSAFRCTEYQNQLRGRLPAGHTAVNTSQHELGKAADITHRSLDKLGKVVEEYFLAIGTARTFLHVDLREGKKRRWDYK